jgi:alpha-galactosidase
MAGNDLRNMPNNVRDILTNRQVIRINQDTRGIQGYRISSNDGVDVYNKPLSDGTTAVLLLNKSDKKARVSVAWSSIGLIGKQPVYDVWSRRLLGMFDGGFTSEPLAQHDHMLLRIGHQGEPLPGPEPLPLDQYTITRKGITQLSSLCYIWKSGNHAVMDLTAERDLLILDGRHYRRGIGCKGKSNLMYKLSGKANRFRATVGLSQGNKPGAEGRFRVMEEDFFGNKVLFDSGKLRPDSPAKTIDIDVSGKGCIMLEFTGDDVLGTWADAHVVG